MNILYLISGIILIIISSLFLRIATTFRFLFFVCTIGIVGVTLIKIFFMFKDKFILKVINKFLNILYIPPVLVIGINKLIIGLSMQGTTDRTNGNIFYMSVIISLGILLNLILDILELIVEYKNK